MNEIKKFGCITFRQQEVVLFQIYKQNLEGKTVSVSGGDGGITRQITDRNIKVVYDRNIERQ